MSYPTNTALKIAGIALALSGLGAALTGCGGSDSDGASADGASAKASAKASASTDGASASGDAGPVKDAATQQFCGKFITLYTSLNQLDRKQTAAVAKATKAFKEWADDALEEGLPSSMSAEAREGFQFGLAAIVGEPGADDISAEDNNKVNEFGTWASKNCMSAPAPSDGAS